ncbi:GlcNAc-PI de-N-acetylase [Prochlorococcus marinus str. MIT 1313]|nr:GlcNAc-PI de-N-acetylase [Prochlorococcus marinus str. MIT 1313]KZR72324.1 GlcNAc-PI de-N-acetylase [Prochlorococcus marinus str. MIT 1318]
MKKNILIIAPHPDDEILGCGGYLLKKSYDSNHIMVVYVTTSKDGDWEDSYIKSKALEREKIYQQLKLKGIESKYMNFPAASLDSINQKEIILAFSDIFKLHMPNIVLLPNPSDIHSDHTICFEIATKCCKPFRQNYVQQIMCYETLSETDIALDSRYNNFRPNYFLPLSSEIIEAKLKLLSIYKTETNSFPFPRSLEAIKAQAMTRGIQVGAKYAEAFQLLKLIE